MSSPASEPVVESAVTVIIADLLIPGRGSPARNAAVALEDGKIAHVGEHDELPEKFRAVRAVHVPVLMPGLWDVHTHFIGLDVVTGFDTGLFNVLPGSNALVGAITVEDLEETLMAGYTSVRELGGYAGDLVPAIEKGRLIGPNVYSSIAAMSITGGHGDQHSLPIESMLRFAECGGPCSIVDGADDCTKTVRLLVRRGARCIKVCSSGGVLSLLDDPEDRQFSDEELKAIVEEASRSRRAVGAHAIGKAGIMAALKAGVKSIEHGMYLDDEVADLMIEKGAIFVPTHHIVTTISKDTSQLPPPIARKVEKLVQKAKDSYRLAIRRGVKIALGTDSASSDRTKGISHGNNAIELYWAVENGMTPLQAIEAGTANGPGVLGGMAPLSGQLKEGYDADLIAVAKNPLNDIEVLVKKENITHVWKGGRLFKSPPGHMPAVVL
ncbi:Putative metal-dependent hydrolase, composite domain superfamily [Colletotrichum destructivum]|uniref:Metal-dependent hydrolase, composite domain superfamily n=1 Tax=Colletotrichum destructivum TaxID=34406 RepID=A0AAX4IB91_9PEZI|nr:Putative metal-dependent hydrolase, composite domain superfamily [Colletotrichum destructivum]